MDTSRRAARRPRTLLAAAVGGLALAVAVGPGVGVADAAKTKKKKAPAVTSIKAKQLELTVDPNLAAAVGAQGISFGPVAPATGDAESVTLKAKGTIKVKSGKVVSGKLALSGGIGLDTGPLGLGSITIGTLNANLEGKAGTVTSVLEPALIAGTITVLDVSGSKVSGKTITGKLKFAADVGSVLGAILPDAATGKPFGTFVVS